MSPRIRWLALASLWMCVTFGMLAIERIPGDYAHAFCGRWGCLPPLQALAAMHGFWLMLLTPPTAWLILHASATRLWTIGALVFWFGMFGLVVVAGKSLTTWLETGDAFWRYAPQRILFSILMATDWPFCQLALAGGVLWAVGRRRMRWRGTLPEERPTDLHLSNSPAPSTSSQIAPNESAILS